METDHDGEGGEGAVASDQRARDDANDRDREEESTKHLSFLFAALEVR